MLHLHLTGKGAALPHQQPFPGWVKMAVGRPGEPLLLYGGNSHLECGEKDSPFGGSSPLAFKKIPMWVAGNFLSLCREILLGIVRKFLPHMWGNFHYKMPEKNYLILKEISPRNTRNSSLASQVWEAQLPLGLPGNYHLPLTEISMWKAKTSPLPWHRMKFPLWLIFTFSTLGGRRPVE